MENLREFMQRDQDEVAAEQKEFTLHVRSQLNRVYESCAADTEQPLDDLDNGNFQWFANCVRNNAFMHTTLGQNATVKKFILGVHY